MNLRVNESVESDVHPGSRKNLRKSSFGVEDFRGRDR